MNLFPQTAEPILVDQRNYEYSVIPDVRRVNALEIFSVDEVVTIAPTTNELIRYEPFYSYRHSTVRERKQTFWMANRRQSGRRDDEGTEIYLSMVISPPAPFVRTPTPSPCAPLAPIAICRRACPATRTVISNSKAAPPSRES